MQKIITSYYIYDFGDVKRTFDVIWLGRKFADVASASSMWHFGSNAPSSLSILDKIIDLIDQNWVCHLDPKKLRPVVQLSLDGFQMEFHPWDLLGSEIPLCSVRIRAWKGTLEEGTPARQKTVAICYKSVGSWCAVDQHTRQTWTTSAENLAVQWTRSLFKISYLLVLMQFLTHKMNIHPNQTRHRRVWICWTIVSQRLLFTSLVEYQLCSEPKILPLHAILIFCWFNIPRTQWKPCQWDVNTNNIQNIENVQKIDLEWSPEHLVFWCVLLSSNIPEAAIQQWHVGHLRTEDLGDFGGLQQRHLHHPQGNSRHLRIGDVPGLNIPTSGWHQMFGLWLRWNLGILTNHA